MAITSMPAIRRRSFEIFQAGHLLMFLFLPLCAAHGTAHICVCSLPPGFTRMQLIFSVCSTAAVPRLGYAISLCTDSVRTRTAYHQRLPTFSGSSRGSRRRNDQSDCRKDRWPLLERSFWAVCKLDLQKCSPLGTSLTLNGSNSSS